MNVNQTYINNFQEHKKLMFINNVYYVLLVNL